MIARVEREITCEITSRLMPRCAPNAGSTNIKHLVESEAVINRASLEEEGSHNPEQRAQV